MNGEKVSKSCVLTLVLCSTKNNRMKRRKFLTNSAVLGTAIPLGVATPAILTSCSGNAKRTSPKIYSTEELGMFSFVDIAPEGKPLKAALVGCGDRGTGAAVDF
jgi:hypothetical protein